MKGTSQPIKDLVEKPRADSIYLFGKSFPPDFSITNAGQMFATGLSKSGYLAMTAYVQANKEARAKAESDELEKQMLQRIKDEHNIKHNSYEEAEAAKRAGNMNQDAAAAEALPELAFDYDLL